MFKGVAQLGLVGALLIWGSLADAETYKCSLAEGGEPTFVMDFAEGRIALKYWEVLSFSGTEAVDHPNVVQCTSQRGAGGEPETLLVNCVLWPVVYADDIILVKMGRQLTFELYRDRSDPTRLLGSVSQFEIPGNIQRLVDTFHRQELICEQASS